MTQEFDFSTPMMQQYLKLKAAYPDCLLWFRLGDFYEMFLDQAEIGSRVLGITLTSRSRGKDGRIPMAGIPYHAAETYLHKLVQAGYKVAICEQLTPPGKGLVERDVIRIITPGTLLDERSLSQKNNNYLYCLRSEGQQLAIGVVDVSTGELRLGYWPKLSSTEWRSTVTQILGLYPPAECAVNPSLQKSDQLEWLHNQGEFLITTPEPWNEWEEKAVSQKGSKLLHTTLLLPSELSQPFAQQTLAILWHYLDYTQKTPITHLQPPQPLLPANYLIMDRSTINNLELFTTLYGGQTYGSLLHTIDTTLTPMGGRLLKQWLSKPLHDALAITQRQDEVEFFITHQKVHKNVRSHLQRVTDIERLLARLNLGVGNPRDVLSLAQALEESLAIFELLKSHHSFLTPTVEQLQITKDTAHLIKTQIQDTAPVDLKVGRIIQSGVHTQLDELRSIVAGSQEIVAQLETAERAATNIASLKIKYNQVFGYYIEVSKSNLSLVPTHYERKQTLVNAERFVTPELKVQEEIILNAQNKILDLECKLFTQIVAEVVSKTSILQIVAQTIAQWDNLTSLAQLAHDHNYTRPKIVESGELRLKASRHPVLETIIPGHTFVPNDIELEISTQQLILLTGPNMAGKSVLMRQVALITLLAHMGSFVPADTAVISLTDRIFVRSGASDMITGGLSTFMVEMVETATILHQATDKSLVVMDEIGRGTSTYDGISLAWAIAEHLVSEKTGPKTLFATHYHELQTLAEKFPGRIVNYHLAVTEDKGNLVFLYALQPGGSPHSHGVQVAKLAGLPKTVIKRAETLLSDLEQRTDSKKLSSSLQLPKAADTTKLQEELEKIDIQQLSPLEALNVLARLQKDFS